MEAAPEWDAVPLEMGGFPLTLSGPALVTLWTLSPHVGCDATSMGTGCMGCNCDLFPNTTLTLPLGFTYTLGLQLSSQVTPA